MVGPGAMSSHMTHPLLTVVVPVWDEYVRFLPDCLAHIRSQDGVEPRVLVVDNASTVDLPDLPDGVALTRLPTRIAAGPARNAGLALVTTPYVCFVDADDIPLPGTFRFCIERLERRPDVVACATASLAWDAETNERAAMDWPRRHVYRLVRHRHVFALYMLGRCALPLTTRTILRTETARDAGGFGGGNLAEDWTLGAALAFRGTVELHHRPGHLYRQHAGSLFRRVHSAIAYDEALRELRLRLRSDPAVPAWVKAALPLVGLAHRLKSLVLARAGERLAEAP
jgi:glycosyltransferase involved in cell wall biosynthesis